MRVKERVETVKVSGMVDDSKGKKRGFWVF